MTKILENPHIRENNAREEQRQYDDFIRLQEAKRRGALKKLQEAEAEAIAKAASDEPARI